jgi:hypothetical protein
VLEVVDSWKAKLVLCVIKFEFPNIWVEIGQKKPPKDDVTSEALA